MSTGFPDWTRAYLLIGSHEGELIPVYVDADGKLFAALQGEYEGQLRTIALDDQGRISAFIIDSTDAWGQMLAVGNAELAARLGSPVIYSQSGRVVLMETFKHGKQRIVYTVSGTGGSVTLSPTYWLTDGYSLKLVTGSTDFGFADFVFYYGQFPNTKIGWSACFLPATEYLWFELLITIFDGTYQHYADVILNNQQECLQIDAKSYGITKIADVYTHPFEQTRFRHMKVVLDLETGYYVSLFLDNLKYDISNYQYNKSNSTAPPRCCLGGKLTGREGYNDIAYIDNCIFTTNEP